MRFCKAVIAGLALKVRREQEAKIHSQLHSNLHTLTLLFPPSDDFRRVFVRDMFVKNNKAAFHHVVYYLLSVLEPDLIKTKITSWPLFSPKQEAQFRGEVMKYVNELNGVYEFANVPLLMTSHLISPGGYKFARFMLKLSQLVMTVVLQKDLNVKVTFLYPLKANKNAQIAKNNLQRLKQKTRQIERETVLLYAECDEYVKWARCEAKKIVEEKKIVKEKLKNHQKTIEKNLKINSIETKTLTDTSFFILAKCLLVEELKSFLFAKEIVLNFNETTRTRILCADAKLNLVVYFATFGKFLATIRLQKPHFSSYDLDSALETASKTNNWLLMLCKVFEEVREKTGRLSGVVEGVLVVNKGSFVCEKNDVLDSNEVLAVPLEDLSPKKIVV